MNTETCNSYKQYNFTSDFTEKNCLNVKQNLKDEPFKNAYTQNASDLNLLPAVYVGCSAIIENGPVTKTLQIIEA